MPTTELDTPPAVMRASNLALATPASQRLLGLMLAGVAVSLGVLYSHHAPADWWQRLRDRRRGGARPEPRGGKKAQRHLAVVATDTLAAITLVNGLLAFFAPVEIMSVEVPQEGAYHLVAPEPIPSTALGYAVVFCLLTTVALIVSSLHIWGCYVLGRQIAGHGPPPRWQTVSFGAFLLSFGACWSEGQLMNQINLRRLSFADMFQKGISRSGRFLPLFVVSIVFAGLYVALNVAMVLVFARALNALAGQAQDVLDARRARELQALGLKSIVFTIGNILLYSVLWFCMGIYPLNLRLAEITAMYHLPLLLLLELCFNVRGLRCCGGGGRSAPPPPGVEGDINNRRAAAAAGLCLVQELVGEEQGESKMGELEMQPQQPTQAHQGRGRRLLPRWLHTAAAGGGGGGPGGIPPPPSDDRVSSLGDWSSGSWWRRSYLTQGATPSRKPFSSVAEGGDRGSVLVPVYYMAPGSPPQPAAGDPVAAAMVGAAMARGEGLDLQQPPPQQQPPAPRRRRGSVFFQRWLRTPAASGGGAGDGHGGIEPGGSGLPVSSEIVSSHGEGSTSWWRMSYVTQAATPSRAPLPSPSLPMEEATLGAGESKLRTDLEAQAQTPGAPPQPRRAGTGGIRGLFQRWFGPSAARATTEGASGGSHNNHPEASDFVSSLGEGSTS